jgi:hypothetical protein
VEAAGSEPAPGGAKLPAESRPYLVTARNAWDSSARRVPWCPVLFRPIPQVPATYVQHSRPSQEPVGLLLRNTVCKAGDARALPPQAREEETSVEFQAVVSTEPMKEKTPLRPGMYLMGSPSASLTSRYAPACYLNSAPVLPLL